MRNATWHGSTAPTSAAACPTETHEGEGDRTASKHHGTARVDDQVPERRHIIFDPIPRVDGSESSDDPLTEVRADLSLLSGRRRRAVFGDGRR